MAGPSDAYSAEDHACMARALQLAERGLLTTTPNPRVGCVLTRDGIIVGEGFHERAGAPHAEAHALDAAGARACGATAYVTLEPCCHFGRTPPCAEALIAARVARVVVSIADPNPLVAGKGIERIRAAGIAVAVGLMADRARELNIGFFSRMARGRPWVRLKVAASLDGKTALENGSSQWITGSDARRDGHRWRARACALLTGIGTVRDDDPRLDVREVVTARQPLRVIVDSRLETPPGARVFDGTGPLIIVAAVDHVGRRAALQARGAQVLLLPNARGKVDLAALLDELGRRGINELHCEVGFRLNGSLLREACVDELLIYMAPMLLGDVARGMFDLPGVEALTQAQRLRVTDLRSVGDDIRLLARFAALP